MISSKEKIQEHVDLQEKKVDQYEIILHNDDVNTFDFVIDALMDVCEHTLIQAEQCTILVHYKGKASVKSGTYIELKPSCSKLLDLGLSAEIA